MKVNWSLITISSIDRSRRDEYVAFNRLTVIQLSDSLLSAFNVSRTEIFTFSQRFILAAWVFSGENSVAEYRSSILKIESFKTLADTNWEFESEERYLSSCCNWDVWVPSFRSHREAWPSSEDKAQVRRRVHLRKLKLWSESCTFSVLRMITLPINCSKTYEEQA